MKPYIILLLNTSRKHVNYEEDKNKVSIPINKPYNIQHTNICNGIFHISFFKALLINEGETTRGERESGRTGIGAKQLTGRNDPDSNYTTYINSFIYQYSMVVLISCIIVYRLDCTYVADKWWSSCCPNYMLKMGKK